MIDLIERIIKAEIIPPKPFIKKLESQTNEIRSLSLKENLFSYQEFVKERFYERTIDKKKYIIDKNSTKINSTWYALTNYSKPITLIAGGVDNGQDYIHALDDQTPKINRFVSLGKENGRLKAYMKSKKIPIFDAPNEKNIFIYLRDLIKEGETVLFSPGHPSFDLYLDNNERVKRMIHELSKL